MSRQCMHWVATGSAVLHDQSNAIRVGNPMEHPVVGQNWESGDTTTYFAEDRSVHGAVKGSKQRDMGFDPSRTSMTFADTVDPSNGFITYTPRDTTLPTNSKDPLNPRNLGNKTGTVNLDAYIAWLKLNGYEFAS